MVPEKSLGTGIGKIWYRKKVSEPVSENFGTVKSTGIGIVNIWYRKKVSVSVSFKIFGTVKLCLQIANKKIAWKIGIPGSVRILSCASGQNCVLILTV